MNNIKKYIGYKDEKSYKAVKESNANLKEVLNSYRLHIINKYNNKKNPTLVDVGSGWGHFLYTAQKNGYAVLGIELAEECYKYSTEELNLKIIKDDFLDDKVILDKVDVVTMWDVLEHIPEADRAIKKVNSILTDKGLFIFQVPQSDSFISRISRKKWGQIGGCHVQYFSKTSIKRHLWLNGFDVLKIRSSIEPKRFITYNLAKGSEAKRQEYFNEFVKKLGWKLKLIMFLYPFLLNILSFSKIGEEMIVIARKNEKHKTLCALQKRRNRYAEK